jgi:hypothetical protein
VRACVRALEDVRACACVSTAASQSDDEGETDRGSKVGVRVCSWFGWWVVLVLLRKEGFVLVGVVNGVGGGGGGGGDGGATA